MGPLSSLIGIRLDPFNPTYGLDNCAGEATSALRNRGFTYRKVAFQMKMTATVLMLMALLLPNTYPQDYTQMNLPAGAIARFGRGLLSEVLYSPDGARFAVLTTIGIYLYDATTYREVALLTGHTERIWGAVFSPDGKTVAGVGGRTVRLLDIETGDQKQVFTGHTAGQPAGIGGVDFSPDGKVLASASLGDDGTVWLWDTETGEHQHTLAGHTDRIRSVVFSPDGMTVASGSWDGTVRLWDVQTGEQKQAFTGHTEGVESVSFNPDGRTVVSGSGDGTMLLWKVAD